VKASLLSQPHGHREREVLVKQYWFNAIREENAVWLWIALTRDNYIIRKKKNKFATSKSSVFLPLKIRAFFSDFCKIHK